MKVMRAQRASLGQGAAARVLSVALALLLLPGLLGLSGCKDTDLLKRIVYHPYATVPDPNNTVTVNDPDAEDTVPTMSAFELTENAVHVTTEENIVAPTRGEANVNAQARHSIFDAVPRLTGVESTDPVRLVESTAATALDEEVAAEEPPDNWQEIESESAGEGQQSSEELPEAPGADSESGGNGSAGLTSADSTGATKPADGSAADGGGAAGGESGAGGDAGGEAGGTGGAGEGEGSSGDGGTLGDGEQGTGTTARESGGYDGDELVYEPGNRLEKPQASDRIAAIGQAAVVVQAVGGKGALAAMDAYTYQGLNAIGNDAAYASSFASVFGDELEDGFEQSALLWRRDGGAPGYLVDAKGADNTDALVKAVANSDGTGGSIFFCGDRGSQADYFSSKQLKAFKKAGIQLVPVDLSSPQGILDAVTAVGDALAESDVVEQDVAANVRQYKDAFNEVIEAACATHGGKFAVQYAKEPHVYGAYQDNPVSGREVFNIYGAVCTGFEAGAVYEGSGRYRIDTTAGVLTTPTGYSSSPLYLYLQAGGVVTKAAEWSSSNSVVVWGLYDDAGKGAFSDYAEGGAISATPDSVTTSWDILLGESLADWQRDETRNPYGLGSREFPYLIVGPCGGYSAADVKSAIVDASEDRYSPYFAKSYFSDWEDEDAPKGNAPNHIGADQHFNGNLFAETDLTMFDTVRELPCGLIGSWADGNLESVLVSAWIADLYSKKPNGSFYEPINDMGRFSVDIGGKRCSSVEEAVCAFYEAVYRYDASGLYGGIVTDSGDGLV